MPRQAGKHNQEESTPVAPTLTSFEVEVKKFGLAPDQYLRSKKLQVWVIAHKNAHYVPETLLKAWGLPLNFSL